MQSNSLWRVIALTLMLAATLFTAAGAYGIAAWSPPVNLSDWQPTLEVYKLAVGDDGTQAGFWPVYDPATNQTRFYARVRHPGEAWGPVEDLSGPVSLPGFFSPRFWGGEVASDGTTWAFWVNIDASQNGDNRQVMIAQRPPGGTWYVESLSESYETEIRSAQLYVTPDNHLAAVWVACAHSVGPPGQGPCMVHIRRRFPGTPGWEPTERLDGATGMGIERAYVLVARGGLTVVVWMEANPSDVTQWKVRARAWTPSAGAWDASVTDVSPAWFVPTADEILHQPVMDLDGMVVVAWTAKFTPSSTLRAHYSATRSAAGAWSLPFQISTPHTDEIEALQLASKDGTTIAVWERVNSLNQQAIYANARDPGGVWGSNVQLSTAWMFDVDLHDLKLWPDGTAIVLWSVLDNSRQGHIDEAVFWSGRPPGGNWGDVGQGQLSDWRDTIYGAALAFRDDGAGVALWGVQDTNQPVGQQGSLWAASWTPGGPGWSLSELLHDGFEVMSMQPRGVDSGPGGQPIAAAWIVARSVANPTDPRDAIYYSEIGGKIRVYLPLVVR